MGQLNIEGGEFLGKAFEDTATSYKFLFFKSLLDSIQFSSGKDSDLLENNSISLKKLVHLCIVNAWYPINTFKLSFGKADQVHRHIKNLKEKFPDSEEFKKNKVDLQKFLKEIEIIENSEEVKEIYNNLKKYVPYRFLVPWLKQKLQGTDDNQKNKEIFKLSNEDKRLPADKQKLPYHFLEQENELRIEISQNFINLVQTHSLLIYDWWRWNFAQYLQKHNPLVPGIIYKLEQPETRDLRRAKIYWEMILNWYPNKSINCIYSGEILTKKYDLDHFIPWSFVTHDQLWNIIPVSFSANRMKSDSLPDLEKYLNPFVELQISSLELFRDRYLVHDYKKHSFVEQMEAGYAFSQDENLLLPLQDEKNSLDTSKMKLMLESNIKAMHTLAGKCGFSPGWRYER